MRTTTAETQTIRLQSRFAIRDFLHAPEAGGLMKGESRVVWVA